MPRARERRQLATAALAASIRVMRPIPTLAVFLLLAGCGPRVPAPLGVETPVPIPPTPPEITTHPTADHTCALDRDGRLTCWGRNDAGQLGVHDSALHRAIVAGGRRFEMASVGGRHTCALDTGVVYCWGDNTRGQLGDGGAVSRSTPAPVDSERRFARVTAGAQHSCALDVAGRAYCWGDNRWGQLGTGSRDTARAPAPVATEATFVKLSAGSRHTCGVTVHARVLCWGDHFLGQLARPDLPQSGSGTPVPVALDDSVTAVAAGHGHTCALTADGAGWCWGQNGIGQLGTGAPPGTSAPARVAGTPPLAHLRVGYHHTCAVDTAGAGWCWGANTPSQPEAAVTGQLGATVSWSNLPLRVEALADPLDALMPGDGHTCALARDGVVSCFGTNRHGQLGRAQPPRSVDPLRVLQLEAATAP